MLSLISLNDPSDRAVLLRCANTLSYIHGLSGSYDTEAWKYIYSGLNTKHVKLSGISYHPVFNNRTRFRCNAYMSSRSRNSKNTVCFSENSRRWETQG